jgi:hypothetical protein
MNGNIATLDRRLAKLEGSKTALQANSAGPAVRIIANEGEDVDQIISEKTARGEIKPDTFVIVRLIVKSPGRDK